MKSTEEIEQMAEARMLVLVALGQPDAEDIIRRWKNMPKEIKEAAMRGFLRHRRASAGGRRTWPRDRFVELEIHKAMEEARK